jgi:glucokinase
VGERSEQSADLGGVAVVAIDVGGTSLKAGILGPAGLCVLRRLPSGREDGPEAVLDNVASTAASLVDECADLDLDVAGVGVALPGIVDDAGVGRLSVTMGWRDVPVRERLVADLGRPVSVGHDVRTAGVAEATFGAAAGAGSALFVPIGTGLAAAVVVDGVIHPGATFRAGEIGQILVAPGTTLEAVASARAIAERYAATVGRDGAEIDASDVATLVSAGDPVAGGVWHAAVDALAQVLAAAVATLDIEVLVIGGGLGRAGATLTVPLRSAMAAQLPWRDLPRLVTARFAADAGFVGAAIEAWRCAAGRDVGELAGAIAAAPWDRADETVRP